MLNVKLQAIRSAYPSNPLGGGSLVTAHAAGPIAPYPPYSGLAPAVPYCGFAFLIR